MKMTLEEQIVRHVLEQAQEYQQCAQSGRDRIVQELVDEVGTLIRASPGVKTLRDVLERMRSETQGGYSGRYRGKWTFVSTGLPQTAPVELDRLFVLAGVVPDEIYSLGSCDRCANAEIYKDGSRGERGYKGECLRCVRPRMSNFVPLHEVTAQRKREARP